jgi:hypothetical protein
MFQYVEKLSRNKSVVLHVFIFKNKLVLCAIFSHTVDASQVPALTWQASTSARQPSTNIYFHRSSIS